MWEWMHACTLRAQRVSTSFVPWSTMSAWRALARCPPRRSHSHGLAGVDWLARWLQRTSWPARGPPRMFACQTTGDGGDGYGLVWYTTRQVPNLGGSGTRFKLLGCWAVGVWGQAVVVLVVEEAYASEKLFGATTIERLNVERHSTWRGGWVR